MRLSPKIGFVVLALLWGSEWLLGAVLPAPPPLAGLALRYGIASFLLLPFLLRRSVRATCTRALLGPTAIALGILCLPQLLGAVNAPHLPGALAIATLAAVPVLLAAAGRLQLSTALCGFAGVLFLTGTALEVRVHELPWLLCALLAAGIFASALASAGSTTRGIAGTGVPAMLWCGLTVSALVLAVASRLVGEVPVWSVGAVGGTVIGAVLMTLCGYGLFFALLQRLGAGSLSTLTWAQLLVATVESAAVYHIRPTWEAGLGAALIVTALVLALRSDASADNQTGTGLMLQMTQR